MQAKINMQTPTYLVNSAMTVNSSDATVVAAINSLGTTIGNKLDTINPIATISTTGADISSKITTLGESINGMQIVMDSGALVGALSSGMDSNRGRSSTMKGRGV